MKSRKRINRKIRPRGGGDVDENMSGSQFESTASTNLTPSMKTQQEDGSDSLDAIKTAVVVLTRLPQYKINSLRPPTPQQFYSEDESLSSSDSEMQWKPEGDSSDSDFSGSTNRRRAGRGPAAPQLIRNNEAAPIIISSVFSYCATEVIKTRPNLPEEEVKVDMIVLAKKKSMKWQRGKISDLVMKEGRLKYKVCFEEKGRSLVSGHHIAFDTPPSLEQLYVGARLVISCQEDGSLFQPGILAELPTRRNRSRFLVFLDDHTPIYVGLSSLRLVCRPLEDPIDDLSDGLHKSFMTRYLRNWPYPHLTQYSIGHILNAELGGEQQRCEVQQLDGSLMQVVFQDNQHQEWIHRGSTRLQHMSRFWEMKELDAQDSE